MDKNTQADSRMGMVLRYKYISCFFKLIKHIMAYVNDEDTVSEDIVINIAFTPIKLQLKRDLVKFEETKGRRSIAGKIGAEKRWQREANDGNRINGIANDGKGKQTMAKIAVNDNVNVKEKDIHIYSFLNSLIDYGFDKDLSKEWMKVRKDKGATNTLTAFKGFVKEVEKNGNDINFILRTCIERSWKGFNSEWIPKVITELNREPSKWKAPWS